jgi:hypothetical protein|tara:strand:+ start:1977 stop:2165 length:189 start_codon:yes stop_codon:yes gene_type:complete
MAYAPSYFSLCDINHTSYIMLASLCVTLIATVKGKMEIMFYCLAIKALIDIPYGGSRHFHIE